jgi:hypothetical protein
LFEKTRSCSVDLPTVTITGYAPWSTGYVSLSLCSLLIGDHVYWLEHLDLNLYYQEYVTGDTGHWWPLPASCQSC